MPAEIPQTAVAATGDPQRFAIEGMTCAACARRVEKALGAVPGVRAARVDFAVEQAQVDAPDVAPEALAAAVAGAGYRLVPAKSALTEHDNPSFIPVLLGLLATTPLMLPMLGVPLHLDWRVQLVLASAVVFGVGWGFLVRAARLALRGETAMDTLIALGALLGLVLGVWEALRGAPHPPFEIAASLIAILRLGRWIETRARHRATGSVRDLLRLAPAQAERLGADDASETVAVADLRPDDRVRVRPGGAIPVDGTVMEGDADVDEALLTGEPLPVPKHAGDTVLAGAVVHGGSLVVRVTAGGAHTWLAALADQVAAATAARPPAQVLADRVSAVFVPAILILSVVTFAAWWGFGGNAAQAARIAITVLVVACPCALGLATPVAMAFGLGNAARQGVLVRDQRALDALGRATDLVLDKTGTLTRGLPSVQSVQPLADLDEARLLALAAALERSSEHPVARALRTHDQGVTITDWRSIPAGGVEATIDGARYALGSLRWTGVEATVPDDAIAIAMTRDGKGVGVILLADPLRPETPAILAQAREHGLALHLLSGDRPEAVARMTADLPLATRAGGVDPAGKAARIRELQTQGKVVAFAGDGINDAAALATADAGISLPGLDATAAAAGLNLRRDGLQPLLDLYHLARRLRRIIAQNLGWAFGYNLVLVPIAAFGLLDHIGGPVTAGIAMAASSLTVVLNALRLRR